MVERLLNLLTLASEPVDAYRLVRFEGREAISEPFDYQLEILTQEAPDIERWIGKAVAFNIVASDQEKRPFGGQIHEVMESGEGANFRRFMLRVRPAFFGMAHVRGISFYQDKNAIDILRDLTSKLENYSFENRGAKARKRAYAVKYEETEFEFVTRLLAQEGIMYFFRYDEANPLAHKMLIASSTNAYEDIALGGELQFALGNDRNSITGIQRAYHLHAHLHGFTGVAVNALDQVIDGKRPITTTDWSRVQGGRRYENVAGVADKAELDVRGKALLERLQQDAETITGTSSVPQLAPTVRIPNAPGGQPSKLVVTSVVHSATDAGSRGTGAYRNSFTAIDASRTYRAPYPSHRQRTPGPIMGKVALKDAREGQIEVDAQGRIPVWITHAHPRATIIWLPVQQAWAHADYGAQFIPRVGTQVMIDFLYGDPDLPFVAGCFYTPSQKYPFPLPDKRTRTGWRSKTEKNGAIVQEIMFEDKQGGEEIHLYTGRNFRRQIDADELATINANNIKTVKKDQTLKVVGKRDLTIDKTQTVTVKKKALFESKQEIEIKVGPSTIKLTQSGIEINAPKITVKAETTMDLKAGAKLSEKAPTVQVNGDGMVTIKGGMVKIN